MARSFVNAVLDLNPEFWLADEPTQLVSRSIQNYIEDCDIAKTEIQNDP